MWGKKLGLALLAVMISFSLQACQSYHRGYRDGYAPGYVGVRVITPRAGVVVRQPVYPGRYYYYDSHGKRHIRKFKDKHHDGRYDHH